MSFPWTIHISEEMYQKLKVILEEEHGKEFGIEDVREIADELVELCLLTERLDTKRRNSMDGFTAA